MSAPPASSGRTLDPRTGELHWRRSKPTLPREVSRRLGWMQRQLLQLSHRYGRTRALIIFTIGGAVLSVILTVGFMSIMQGTKAAFSTWQNWVLPIVVPGLLMPPFMNSILRLLDIMLDLSDQHRVLSEHDQLTGALNRRGLFNAANRFPLLTVTVADIDGFKAINDAHGHHIGDHVLRAVAAELSTLRGPGSLLARTGGDEFVLLSEGVGQHRSGSHRLSVDAGLDHPVLVSLGVAERTSGEDLDALLSQADADMYRTKKLVIDADLPTTSSEPSEQVSHHEA